MEDTDKYLAAMQRLNNRGAMFGVAPCLSFSLSYLCKGGRSCGLI